MLRIALPTQSLRTEEKRNLLLRIKYGSLHYDLHHTHENDNDLFVEGHSVAHRQFKRIIPKVPDYGRRRFFKPLASKNFVLGITSSKLTSQSISKENKIHNTTSTQENKPDEHSATSEDDLDLDIRFRYASHHKGAPLEALHEHSDEDGQKSLDPLKFSNVANSNKINEKKVLPEIAGSNSRKMSYTRRYSKDSDIDYYKRRNPSRAGSISAWSTSSDRSLVRLPMSRRRSKRWKSKDSSRRSSKAESVDLEPTAWYGFHESDDKEKHIWFDYPGIDLTFVDVQQALEKVIPDAFETKKINLIQFENVNVKLANTYSKNKWHVELSDLASKKKLVDTGLVFPKPTKQKGRTTSSRNKSFSQRER